MAFHATSTPSSMVAGLALWALGAGAIGCTCAPAAPATRCAEDRDCPGGHACDRELRFCYLLYPDAGGRPGADGGPGADGAGRDGPGPDQGPWRLNGPPEGLRHDIALLGVSPDETHAVLRCDEGRVCVVALDGGATCQTDPLDSAWPHLIDFDLVRPRALLRLPGLASASRLAALDLASCALDTLLEPARPSCAAAYSSQTDSLVHGCAEGPLRLQALDLASLGSTDLSGDLGASQQIVHLQLAPDFLTAVYVVSDGFSRQPRLFADRVDVVSHIPLVEEGLDSFVRFQISPDSSRVLYVAWSGQGRAVTRSLRSARLDGSGPQAVQEGLEGVAEPLWLGATTVAYSALVAGASRLRLARLSGAGWSVEQPFENSTPRGFLHALGDQRLLAIFWQVNSATLYLVDTSGANIASRPLSMGGESVYHAVPSPDGAWVAYAWYDAAFSTRSISLVGIDGQRNARVLELPFATLGPTLDFSPDSQRLLVRGQVEELEREVLYAYPADGAGAGQRLDAVQVQRGNVQHVHPLSDSALYLADQDRNELVELYQVGYEGGAPLKISPPLRVAGGGVQGWRLLSDQRRAVYWSDEQYCGNGLRFYAAEIGGSDPRPLSDDPADASSIDPQRIRLTPDGTWLIYQTDVDGGSSLWAVDTATGARRRLDEPTVATPTIFGLSLSPDGQHLAYCGAQEGSHDLLYVAHLDGSPLSRVYDAPSETSNRIACYDAFNVVIDANSSRMVWAEPESSGAWYRIVSARLNGSDKAALGEADYLPLLAVNNIVITPDSSRVVWVRGARFQGSTRLVVAPIAGGAPQGLGPTELAPDAWSNPRITRHSLTALLCYSGQDDRLQLWSVALDGSASARVGPEVSFAPYSCGFALAAGDSRVLFANTPASATARHLWIAPAAGGAATLLSDALAAGGISGLGYGDDPPRDRVLFVGVDADGRRSLRASGYDGSPQAQLGPSFGPEQGALGFRLLPGSGRVVLGLSSGRAMQTGEPIWSELWLVGLDGATQPLVEGEINQLEVTPDESLIFYDLTEDASLGISGLYARHLPPAL